MKIRATMLATLILTVSAAPAKAHMNSECVGKLENLYAVGRTLGLEMRQMERGFEGDTFDALLIYKHALETLSRAVIATLEPCAH